MRVAEWKWSEGGWATQNHKVFFTEALLGQLLSWHHHHRSAQEVITVDDHNFLVKALWRPGRCLCLVECTLGNSEGTDGDNLQLFPLISWEEGGNLGGVSPGVLWEGMSMWGHPSSIVQSHSHSYLRWVVDLTSSPQDLCLCYFVIIWPCRRFKIEDRVSYSYTGWVF